VGVSYSVPCFHFVSDRPVLRSRQKDFVPHILLIVLPNPHREMKEVVEGSILFMLANSRSDHHGFFCSGTGLRTPPYVLTSQAPKLLLPVYAVTDRYLRTARR
jgi:hypothetical protein